MASNGQANHLFSPWLSPDSEIASGEIGQNNGGFVWLQRAFTKELKRGTRASASGATQCGPVVLSDLQGKGFVQPAVMSGQNIHKNTEL